MRLHKQLLFLFACAFLLAPASRAQFVGYVANQTVNQKVFTNADCSVTLTSGSLTNIGQVGHALSYSVTSPGANLIVAIQGSADGATYFQISNNAPVQPGIIAATGSYPFIRAQVSGGGAGCTITANYYGSSVATTVNLTGANAQFMYLFNPFINAAAGTTANSANLSPPYGNTAGYLVFSYLGGAGPSGSTIAIKAIDGPTGTTYTVATFNLATTAATAQVFPVQGYSSNTTFVAYTAGGASANTFTLSYYFTYPGQGPSATGAPTNVNIVSPNPLPVTFSASAADPCQNSGAAKSSVAVNVTSATTTSLIAVSGSKAIYVCGGSLDANVNASSAITFQLEYGTGAACTSPTALTGQMVSASATGTGPVVFPLSGSGTVLAVPASNGLCLVTAQTSGANINVQGFISYVQQ